MKFIITLLITLVVSCNNHPDIKLEKIKKVTVLFPHAQKQKYITVDKSKIEDVVNAINMGTETKSHKCIYIGSIALNSDHYKLLGGHEDGYCEIIINKKFYKIKLNKTLTEILKKQD